MDISFKIKDIYQLLLNTYGYQGWWPFLKEGYHPFDYTYPKTKYQIFEIYLGVILTQNTTFSSVEKSLQNLKKLDCINPKKFLAADEKIIKEAIKPSGYFNQKYQYILNVITFLTQFTATIPKRDELLSIKGIGQESADTILLYAYNQEQFVVDAYTKRIVLHLGFLDEKAKYEDIKKIFEDTFIDETNKVVIFQEFHALIVVHAKKYYSKKPYGIGCFLNSFR